MAASRILLGLSIASAATFAGAGAFHHLLFTKAPQSLRLSHLLTMQQLSPPMAPTSL